MANKMDSASSDAELIKAYLSDNDEDSFEILVNRYYPQVYRRIRKNVEYNEMIAEELTQDCWIKVINSLPAYEHSDRFSNWLNTIVRNVLNDHWGMQSRRIKSDDSINSEDIHELIPDKSTGLEAHAIQQDEINHLVTVLIPELPVDQRMIYLLIFESSLWDNARPMEWSHLAELNGISTGEAWARFESARKHLMTGKKVAQIDRDELLIFLVWTQAKRAEKLGKYTLKYFAELLNEPEQNLKNRNHAAQKELRSRLSQFRTAEA